MYADQAWLPVLLCTPGTVLRSSGAASPSRKTANRGAAPKPAVKASPLQCKLHIVSVMPVWKSGSEKQRFYRRNVVRSEWPSHIMESSLLLQHSLLALSSWLRT